MSMLLRGKQPTFIWGAEQQKSFDLIKDLLLGGIHLAAPNYDFPFHLATDASEEGKGAVLYQLPDLPIEAQYPHSVKTHSPDNMAIVSFFSKAWTEAQSKRPPFYLEADALLWSIEKAKFYALSSRFPLYTYSDHLPLSWMNKSEKGPVSQFLIEKLSEIETVHSYIQGADNSIPDAASRHPLLGPRRLAPRGLTHSVAEVLRRIPDRFKDSTSIHVHAGTHSIEARKAVQLWATKASSVEQHAPPRSGSPQICNLAIMIPRNEVAPVAAALYLLSTIPFAVLVPVDLLTQTYAPGIFAEAPHSKLLDLFTRSGKITILASQMTWVIGNIAGCCPVETFASAPSTPIPSPGSSSDADTFTDATPQTIEGWIDAQTSDPDFTTFIAGLEHVAVRDNLHLHAPPNEIPKILVPPSVREPLIRSVHVRMFHLGPAKVSAEIAKTYFWPKLVSETRRVLNDCPDCELEKARQATAHGLFAARPHDAPRARWAMDFQGQGLADSGETQALGLIDTTPVTSSSSPSSTAKPAPSFSRFWIK